MQLMDDREWKRSSYFGAVPRLLNIEPSLLLSCFFVFKDTAREDDISAGEQSGDGPADDQ